MASKGQMTGMRGVYLAAAELSRLGFIVSPTSRSAIGADLLVTDQRCQKAWSVQVKTNGKEATFWLISARTEEMYSDSHIYVFVNIRKEGLQPEYYVVPSSDVAMLHKVSTARTGSVWHYVDRREMGGFKDGWTMAFGEILPTNPKPRAMQRRRSGSLFGAHAGSITIAPGVDLIAPVLDVVPDGETGRELEHQMADKD